MEMITSVMPLCVHLQLGILLLVFAVLNRHQKSKVQAPVSFRKLEESLL